jgi:hypothetical protein
MQIEKLVLDLRPRSNYQALDLGFSLLRLEAAQTYLSFLALWLPLMAIITLLACLSPTHSTWLILIGWWLRPLLERAPLYVLSRAVFGEKVSWQAAVRAWPSQLAGGWLYLLALRPFLISRCLGQPIWQLEGARGKTAKERYNVISRQGAGTSAGWFGLACVHFEAVLQFGLVALISLFFSENDWVNPFALLLKLDKEVVSISGILLTYGLYTLSIAVIAPIYTAGGLTLYLNRRATLEAWDIELVLRQIQAPGQVHSTHALKTPGRALAWLTPLLPLLPLLLVLQLAPQPTQAAESASAAAAAASTAAASTAAVSTAAASTSAKSVAGKPACTPPEFWNDPDTERGPDYDAKQTALRQQIREIYNDPDLRSFECESSWQLKPGLFNWDWFKDKKKEERKKVDPWFGFGQLGATLIKILIIVAALALLIFIIWRYRDQFGKWLPQTKAAAATEVGGLDIRPESLPKSVTDTVKKLWQQQQRRAALALLYRATLSRLVSEHGLHISRGATEGDCLRIASSEREQLGSGCWQITQDSTALWLPAAYGEHWPDTDQVWAACTRWDQAFGTNNAGQGAA